VHEPTHLVLNSNKWFSAVSAYSFQLALYLHHVRKAAVLLGAHPGSPLFERAELQEFQKKEIPFLPPGIGNFMRSWCCLSNILKQQISTQTVVWTFEGREHTLCILHRAVMKSLWKHAILVRVRGQAGEVKPGYLNRLVYTRFTDKLVCVASIVARRIPFHLSATQSRVFPYCVEIPKTQEIQPHTKKSIQRISFLENAPDIDFSDPVFLVVGRYDPVKGHEGLIKAFAKCAFTSETAKVQLIFVGESKNVRARDLFETGKSLFAKSAEGKSRFWLADETGKKNIFIFDERRNDIEALMAQAHFGIIPSLGSEVICRVAVEFMKNGTPLLVSDAGALPEVAQGSPSRVFAAGHEESMCSALEWAYSMACDDVYHSRFRKRAQEFVATKYSWEKFDDMVSWITSRKKETDQL
jgi:glycosyltransferase involved in cell wall biosynthesis